jgi:predicted GNAT family acetyltransferase
MPITNNTAQNRYELSVDGPVAVADYTLDGDMLSINRVYVPDALRGKGLAAQVMDFVIADADARGLHIVPVCSYAVTYMARHRL